MHVKPSVTPAGEVRFGVNFLKDYLQFSVMKGFMLGISGGQDSSLAGRLCPLAVEELRWETGGAYMFIVLRLPYGVQKDEDDAQRALRLITVSIPQGTTALVKARSDSLECRHAHRHSLPEKLQVTAIQEASR